MMNPRLALMRHRQPVRQTLVNDYKWGDGDGLTEFEYNEGAGQSCPCVIVPQLLVAMGARRAAKMHRKGEGQNGWVVQDWRYHLADEERYFFPMLLRVADSLEASGCATCADLAAGIRNAVKRLGREHGELRRDFLDKDLVPPPAVVRKHGVVEDALIMKFEPEIRRELRRMRMEKVAA